MFHIVSNDHVVYYDRWQTSRCQILIDSDEEEKEEKNSRQHGAKIDQSAYIEQAVCRRKTCDWCRPTYNPHWGFGSSYRTLMLNASIWPCHHAFRVRTSFEIIKNESEKYRNKCNRRTNLYYLHDLDWTWFGLPETSDGFTGLMVVSKYLSKYPFVKPIKTKIALEIANRNMCVHLVRL